MSVLYYTDAVLSPPYLMSRVAALTPNSYSAMSTRGHWKVDGLGVSLRYVLCGEVLDTAEGVMS